MTKREFLDALSKKLSDMPKREIEDRLGFYSEMIDDRVEDGLTEEEAVLEIGSVDELASRIVGEAYVSSEDSTEIAAVEYEALPTKKKDKHSPMGKILFWLGSPLWLVLALSLFAVVVALYAVLFSAVASLWAVFAACAVSAPGMIVITAINIVNGGGDVIMMIATALVAAGVAIFAFYGSMAATKGFVLLTKECILYFKKLHRE